MEKKTTETNAAGGNVIGLSIFSGDRHPDLAPVDKEAIRAELKASRRRHTVRVKSILP